MSNNYTPSKFRRRGRNDFIPGENPDDWNPYTRDKTRAPGYGSEFWLEGWAESERVYEADASQHAVTYVANDDIEAGDLVFIDEDGMARKA